MSTVTTPTAAPQPSQRFPDETASVKQPPTISRTRRRITDVIQKESSNEDVRDTVSETEYEVSSRGSSHGAPHQGGGCPVMHSSKKSFDESSTADSMNYLYEQLQKSKYDDMGDDEFDDARSVGTAATFTNDAARFRSLQVILDRFAEGCMFPVLMIDTKGFIRSVNQETLLLFGYKRWELIGQKINMLMPESVAKRHDMYLRRYETTKQRRIIMEKRDKIFGKRKDGSTVPLTLRVQEVDDMNGGSVYVGFIMDMSSTEELQRITDIFNAMLPASIRDRLKSGEQNIADQCEATVIFADVVGFTEFSADKQPQEVVEFLTRIFKVFDIIAKKFGVEKVKTYVFLSIVFAISSAIMCVWSNCVLT
jgi:PAS domain S-box-containing protein